MISSESTHSPGEVGSGFGLLAPSASAYSLIGSIFTVEATKNNLLVALAMDLEECVQGDSWECSIESF